MHCVTMKDVNKPGNHDRGPEDSYSIIPSVLSHLFASPYIHTPFYTLIYMPDVLLSDKIIVQLNNSF